MAGEPYRTLKSRLLIFGGLFIICSIASFAESPQTPQPLRMLLNGGGAVIVKVPYTSPEGHSSQLLHEKPGGARILLAESATLSFVSLQQGDLDGDQIPEILAIARNPNTNDFLPFIFKGQTDLKMIFPLREEDTSLIGKEIKIIPGKTSSFLCVKVILPYHDFGPPDLFVNRLYKIRDEKLEKVEERIIECSHFNQRLNLGTHHYHQGEFGKAKQGFQSLIASFPLDMPDEAKAEAFFFYGDTLKFQKDFPKASANFETVLRNYPEAPIAERAMEEHEFLSTYRMATEALSLLIEVSLLERGGKWSDALNLLSKGMESEESKEVEDILLFRKAEILFSLGRAEEALAILKEVQTRFPEFSKQEQVQELIQEFEIPPDK